MSELVGNCPRCNTQAITFDLTQDTLLKNESWIDIGVWETFCVCRRCHRATIFVLEQKNKDHGELKRVGLNNLQGVVNDNAVIRSHINITNIKTRPSPEHLPDSIAAAFQEGSKCLAISCFNATAAMFRLSLDLAIKGLFPGEAVKDSPLGLRLKRLFDNKMLPEALRALSSVVKDEGNAGAHDGTIDEATAEDLIDFTERLLTHLYTEPAKLRLAQERRAQRKAQRTKANS